MKRFFYLGCLCFGCLVLRCTPPLARMPLFDTMAPATVLTLEKDSTQVLIRDYFPRLEKIDGVRSESLAIIANASYDTLTLCLRPDTPPMTWLTVYADGQQASIPVRHLISNTNPSQEAPRLAVFPASVKGDAICSIRVEETPAELLVFWQNSLVETVILAAGCDTYDVVLPGFTALYDRSYVRVFGHNTHGFSNDLLIPLEEGRVVVNANQLTRQDKHTQLLYQVFVDRFCNGNPNNDRTINSKEVLPKVDYYGGDLEGVIQKIEDGFFDELGIRTLWLSPISQNPDDAWGQIENPKTRFSGYHGYWPVYITKIDDRFGTDSVLRALLDDAHAHNQNVILDYVANHMHINSPTLKAHPDWTTSPVTPDGRPNFELWDEFRLTTWFDKHIPKFDFSRPEVCGPLSDSALFWLTQFDIDGFRHDATKHIDELFWRTLTQKVVTQFPNRMVYQIGETYGAPELIDTYVKQGMLDGQFDFNVYDAFVQATVHTDGSFTSVWDQVAQSLARYGWHNLMGNISGNHDRARYISLAGGALDPNEDLKVAGWQRNVGVGDEVGYDYLAMLQAFILTLPGVPCIYYGDEYGMPGANDPDNRRMMQFEGYTPREKALREQVKRITSLRNSHMALLYGDTFPLYADDQVLAYVRLYMDDVVVVCMNKGDEWFDLSALSLPFGLQWNQLVPYMGERMVGPKNFSILINE